jgi:hypothetical protein
MVEIMTYFWHIVNSLIALGALIVAYRSHKKSESSDELDLKIRLAVLEDRVHNIVPHLERAIEKLEEKIDD